MCDARGTTHCAVHSNSHSNVERYVILRQTLRYTLTQLKLSIGDTHSQMALLSNGSFAITCVSHVAVQP